MNVDNLLLTDVWTNAEKKKRFTSVRNVDNLQDNVLGNVGKFQSDTQIPNLLFYYV
jgi:hypothetical protein